MKPSPVASGLPVVAIVGRPNVGKSSLVNRILGRREAIVEPTPGVTRDRRSFVVEWSGRAFEIVDTGGLEPAGNELEKRVEQQARFAIETADVIVLVVDAIAGPLEDDVRVAQHLRRSAKPVILAANKIDDPSDEAAAAEFYRLGLGDPLPVSALHGTGSGDLLDAIVRAVPESIEAAAGAWGSVAIVGRPNVGKSSILNALVGESRVIVDAAPGTTRDPVDSYLQVADGRVLRVADTAGMRRQLQVTDPVEYFSLLRSRKAVESVDAVLVVIDASAGVTGFEQRLAQEVSDKGRACVVALNKWDLVSPDEDERRRLERSIDERLRFVGWAERVRTSALTRRGIERVPGHLVNAIEAHRRRLPTSELNRFVVEAQEARPHPRTGGRRIRILYAAQAGGSPPTVVLFTTGPLEDGYVRYLEGRVRAAERFAGTPLRFKVRTRSRGKVKD